MARGRDGTVERSGAVILGFVERKRGRLKRKEEDIRHIRRLMVSTRIVRVAGGWVYWGVRSVHGRRVCGRLTSIWFC